MMTVLLDLNVLLDVGDFVGSPIPVLTPAELLALLVKAPMPEPNTPDPIAYSSGIASPPPPRLFAGF